MKAIRVDLPNDLHEAEVFVVADYHYADPNSDKDAMRRDISEIASKPNAYCVLAGDLMDCALKSSLGDVYTNLSPMEELTACVEMFGPISHKIIGVVSGNHEARHYKTNGVDMTLLVAKQLGIESRYSNDTALLFVRLGQDDSHAHHKRPILYTIYLTHGTGGGRKEGSKIQRLVDLSAIVDADIYIMGHTHLPATLKTSFARPSAANNSITFCQKLFVNAAAKLKYGGYGDIGGYKPNSTDTPRILLDGTKKVARAIV